VSVDHSGAALAIVVTDDGVGLLTSASHGHGLAIMRERAEELGGTVTIRDASPGVEVAARLPAATALARVSPVPAVPT
jgi:signal transduction histidine kinase